MKTDINKLVIDKSQYDRLLHKMTYEVKTSMPKDSSYMDIQLLTMLLALDNMLTEYGYTTPFTLDLETFNDKQNKS